MSADRVRLCNKEVRAMHHTITGLGWVPVSGGDHVQYEHPTVPGILVLAQTPSDTRWQANFLANLRRLHGDSSIARTQVRGSGGRTAARERRRRRGVTGGREARVFSAPPTDVRRAAALTVVNGKAVCGSCARPWLSDVDPVGRDCPACHSPMVGGAA